jgi:hypothetical protein
MPIVLARLGVHTLQLKKSGVETLRRRSGERAENVVMTPWGKPSVKRGALSDHQRRIRQCEVTPLMYQYGETVMTQPESSNSHNPLAPP